MVRTIRTSMVLVALMALALLTVPANATDQPKGPTTTVAYLPGHPLVWAESVPTPGDPCAEDEPCWDCATMGNSVCGKGPAGSVEPSSRPVTGRPNFTG